MNKSNLVLISFLLSVNVPHGVLSFNHSPNEAFPDKGVKHFEPSFDFSIHRSWPDCPIGFHSCEQLILGVQASTISLIDALPGFQRYLSLESSENIGGSIISVPKSIHKTFEKDGRGVSMQVYKNNCKLVIIIVNSQVKFLV